jgi:glycosyltransferase involved in cell wall biosynthesis
MLLFFAIAAIAATTTTYVILNIYRRKLLRSQLSSCSAQHPSVSVIVTTFQSPDRLGNALKSIQHQTLYQGHIEVIVVDNGSGPSFLQEYAFSVRTFDNSPCFSLQMIHLPTHESQSQARNIGVAHSSRELVAFLDDHYYWLPTKLQRSHAALHALNADFVCTGVTRGRKIIPQGFQTWFLPLLQKFRPSSHEHITTSSVLLRSSLLLSRENQAVFDLVQQGEVGAWCYMLESIDHEDHEDAVPLAVYLSECLVACNI